MASKRIRSALLIAVVIAAIVMFVFSIAWWALRKTADAVVSRREETTDLGAVVTQVKALSRLETASMRVIHVGTIRQSYQLVPDALGGDEITLFAVGDVIAGVDLSGLQPGDVRRESDGTITMRLPPTQILVTRVDNAATHVVARKTGFLRRTDPDLETHARQHAETMIRSEALHRGIINLAQENAEKKLGDFLHTIGFSRVRFVRSSRIPSVPL